MKAKELRIGNWYNSTKFNVPVKCEMADFWEIYSRAEGATPDESHIAELFVPIPLNEKWLLKLGFEEEYSRGTRLLVKDGVRIDMTKSKFPTLQYWVTELKYVHQLQNIYFALTGEELKVKEAVV